MVQEADPDWLNEAVQPVAYKFSNGRVFLRERNPYLNYPTEGIYGLSVYGDGSTYS